MCWVVVVVVFVDIGLFLCLQGVVYVMIIVEYFCDQGKQVLLIMDLLIWYVMVQCEIVLVIGEFFVIRGYLLLVFVCLFQLVE